MKSLTPTSKLRLNARRRAAGIFAIVMASLAMAAPALAQSPDPTSAQYDDTVTQIEEQTGGGSGDLPIASGADSSPAPQPALQQNLVGGLPFTGLDVAALLIVAAALTLVGFALRRLSAPEIEVD